MSSFAEHRLQELCRKDRTAAEALPIAWPLVEQVILEAYATDLPAEIDARAYLEAMKHIRELLDQARHFCPKRPGDQPTPTGPEPLYSQQYPDDQE